MKEKIVKIEKELEKKNEEIARLLSDFNYYKERVKREIEEAVEKEKERLIINVIEIYENLQKACENIKDDGLEMILNQFKKLLLDEGVVEIEAKGKKFDYNLHHVVAVRESGEKGEEGIITEEVKKGYMLNGRVIRPSYVIVSGSDEHGKDNRN